MEFQHYSVTDPRYTLPGQTYTLHNYACVLCGKTAFNYGEGAPYCDQCKAYSMRETGKIEDTKVAEIKSRKAPARTGQTKKGKRGRFEDNLISEMKAVVRPRIGKTVLLLSVNMDKSAFLRGQILAKFGTESFLTSVQEFGAAFSPFDPTVATMQLVETGEEKKFEPKAVKGTTNLGPLKVLGGQSMQKFKDGWVTFKAGKVASTFDMHDIAEVLKYAL